MPADIEPWTITFSANGPVKLTVEFDDRPKSRVLFFARRRLTHKLGSCYGLGPIRYLLDRFAADQGLEIIEFVGAPEGDSDRVVLKVHARLARPSP
jgi:hypothetical protein